MVATGGIIYGSDYNAVRDKVVQVLGSGSPYGPGTGSPNYGYNQTVSSSAVSVSAIITAAQWQNLANDVNTIATHQTNASFSGYSSSYETTGKVITAADLNTLNTNMTTYVTNRLTVSASQLSSVAAPYWRASNWGGVVAPAAIAQTNTITFASANAAQYFFNQGGKIVFQGTYRGTPANNQDTAWQTETAAFTYTLDITAYAGLNATPTNKYTGAGGPGYTTNAITLALSVSGAVITATVTYNDAHAALGAGPDTVTGSTTIGVGFSITTYTATGAFVGISSTNAVTSGSTFV